MTYGPSRLIAELKQLGHVVELMTVRPPGTTDDMHFGVIRDYEVQLGRFATRVIDLGLPATPDFPRTVGSSIHVRAVPQLLELGNVPNIRNIVPSPLGEDWRYWSHNFVWNGETERSAARLLTQVNSIFDRA
jgi:hypothetical protein